MRQADWAENGFGRGSFSWLRLLLQRSAAFEFADHLDERLPQNTQKDAERLGGRRRFSQGVSTPCTSTVSC